MTPYKATPHVTQACIVIILIDLIIVAASERKCRRAYFDRSFRISTSQNILAPEVSALEQLTHP